MEKEFKQRQEFAIAHLLPMVVLSAPQAENQIQPLQVIQQQRH